MNNTTHMAAKIAKALEILATQDPELAQRAANSAYDWICSQIYEHDDRMEEDEKEQTIELAIENPQGKPTLWNWR